MRTQTKSTLGLAAGLTVIAVWSFAASSPAQPRDTVLVPQPATDALTSLELELQQQTAALQRRPPVPPPAPATPRNPFNWDVTPPTAATPLWSPAAEAPQPPAPAAYSTPIMDLVGVASQQIEGRRVLTAVLTGADQAVLLVREGQMLDHRHRLQRVDDDSAELVDTVTGAIYSMRLR